MICVSFEVPILGSSYCMIPEFIRIHSHNDNILFFVKESMVTTTLYRTHKHHSSIIHYLEDTPFLPITMETINSYKESVSFEKNYENLNIVLDMLRFLSPQQTVSVEILLYHEQYFFGKCSFHLLDLYEMGYLTLASVVVSHPFYQQHDTKIFTGLYLVARNAFQKYHYDFVELNFFNNTNNDFLRLSFDMLLQDRHPMRKKLNRLIQDMLTTIPLINPDITQKQLFRDWKRYHDMEIRMSDLRIPLKEWKPSSFLRIISRLLDIFPAYHISPRFHFDITLTKTSTSSSSSCS